MDTWTISELAERAAAALADLEVNGRVQDVPNERLIRWYTTIGLLDPPLRRGRTARYTPRHLLQLVAVKRRQAAGRTLAEIQAELTGAPSEALLALTGPLADVPRPTPTPSPAPPRRFWASPPAAPAGGSRPSATPAFAPSPDEAATIPAAPSGPRTARTGDPLASRAPAVPEGSAAADAPSSASSDPLTSPSGETTSSSAPSAFAPENSAAGAAPGGEPAPRAALAAEGPAGAGGPAGAPAGSPGGGFVGAPGAGGSSSEDRSAETDGNAGADGGAGAGGPDVQWTAGVRAGSGAAAGAWAAPSVAMQGVPLAPGVTLLLEAAALSGEDLAALRAAAEPLLAELAGQGLLPGAPARREDEPHHL